MESVAGFIGIGTFTALSFRFVGISVVFRLSLRPFLVGAASWVVDSIGQWYQEPIP